MNEIMIVTVDNTDAIVMGYNSNNAWYCIKFGTLCLQKFRGKEIYIKDPRIPSNWMISNYYYASWHDAPVLEQIKLYNNG